MDHLRSALTAGARPNMLVGKHRALHYAVNGGQLEAIHALLEAGADLELRNHADHTPLTLALDKTMPKELYERVDLPFLGLDEARDAVERRLLPVVVALIKSGADVDASFRIGKQSRDVKGEFSALYWPVFRGRRRTVLTLLRAGALIKTTDRFELTFTGDEDPQPFSCFGTLLSLDQFSPHFDDYNLKFKGNVRVVSIDGEYKSPVDFTSDDLDAFLADRRSAAQAGAPQPYRVGFKHEELHFPYFVDSNGMNDSTRFLMDAIKKAGSFDEYARFLQRYIHVAILTKCVQEKLPLDIKTVLTTYLWKWGGA